MLRLHLNLPLFTLHFLACSIAWFFLVNSHCLAQQVDGVPVDSVPASYAELWSQYDPRQEPLEVEVLKQWKTAGVQLQVIRYHVGSFLGQPAKLAAIYGYPIDGKNLPGLVQIHGGGQYADANAVLTNAQRGYATISLAWAGRINAPDYHVNPATVQLFWEGQVDDPAYKLTTDWGAVDGYHAPSRFPGSIFPSVNPHPWTIDSVDSPRNSGWYLCAVAARRALTFLEQRPEIDPRRLGVYGHSMGGKLTVLTAADPRVRAAVPSCGGVSDRVNTSRLYEATLCDPAYLKRITCPTFFLSPSNDFHGRIDDLQLAVTELASSDWRVACSPHHNHQDSPSYEVATQLWFDQHLRNADSRIPNTPTCQLQWLEEPGALRLTVEADPTWSIASVDAYVTRQGQVGSEEMQNTIARFWSHIPMKSGETSWIGETQLEGSDQGAWIFANVTYDLESPITGAGYYYRTYTAKQLTISSLMVMKTAEELKNQGVASPAKTQALIEDFQGDWRKEWFTYREKEWPIRTHKMYDPRWAATSDNSRLSIRVQSDQPNPLVIGIDGFAAVLELAGGPTEQNFDLKPADFHSPEDQSLASWQGIRELRLGHLDHIPSPSGNKAVGGPWQGPPPKFLELSWR